MKRFLKSLAIFATLTTAAVALPACEGSTEYGECVGVGDAQEPDLKYRVSTRNAVLGVLFSEMVIPPVVWLADDFYCPVGRVKLTLPTQTTIKQDASTPPDAKGTTGDAE